MFAPDVILNEKIAHFEIDSTSENLCQICVHY